MSTRHGLNVLLLLAARQRRTRFGILSVFLGDLIAKIDRTCTVQFARRGVSRAIVGRALELVEPTQHVGCRLVLAENLQTTRVAGGGDKNDIIGLSSLIHSYTYAPFPAVWNKTRRGKP